MGGDAAASRLVDQYLSKHAPRLGPAAGGASAASSSSAAAPAQPWQAPPPASVTAGPPRLQPRGAAAGLDDKYTVTSSKQGAAAAAAAGSTGGQKGKGGGSAGDAGVSSAGADGTGELSGSGRPEKVLGMFQAGGRLRPSKAKGGELGVPGADKLEKKVRLRGSNYATDVQSDAMPCSSYNATDVVCCDAVLLATLLSIARRTYRVVIALSQQPCAARIQTAVLQCSNLAAGGQLPVLRQDL